MRPVVVWTDVCCHFSEGTFVRKGTFRVRKTRGGQGEDKENTVPVITVDGQGGCHFTIPVNYNYAPAIRRMVEGH